MSLRKQVPERYLSKLLRYKSNKMWQLAYIKFDLPSEGPVMAITI